MSAGESLHAGAASLLAAHSHFPITAPLCPYIAGAAYAASYCFVLITFSCVVGAMSMCVTVASNTAGQASFAMNFLLLFSLVFTGFLVNVNSIPGAAGLGVFAPLVGQEGRRGGGRACGGTGVQRPTHRRPPLPARLASSRPAVWLAWIHYLSVFYYAFEAMITSELSGQLYSFQVGCVLLVPLSSGCP